MEVGHFDYQPGWEPDGRMVDKKEVCEIGDTSDHQLCSGGQGRAVSRVVADSLEDTGYRRSNDGLHAGSDVCRMQVKKRRREYETDEINETDEKRLRDGRT